MTYMNKKQGVQAPNYTQIPNELLELMPDMKETELRVSLAIARKTFGWHKRQDRISLSQLQEITGLSRQGVIDGIAAGVTRGTIKKYEHVKGAYSYSLVVNTVDQTSQHSRPEVVNTVDTQKKGKKLSKDTADTPSGKKPKAPRKPRPRDLLFEAVARVSKLDPITARGSINGATGLLREGKRTPEQVDRFGEIWYTREYPGGLKDHKPPSPATIAKYISWTDEKQPTQESGEKFNEYVHAFDFDEAA